MGIADLFRPKYRHSDVRVRSEAVKAMTRDDAATLIQVARSDRDAGVRRLAIERIDQAEVLAELAAAENERSVRDFAGERAAQLWRQRACSGDAEEANSALAGMIKIGDQRALVDVVVRAQLAAVRKRAFEEVRDPRALAELAKSDAAQDLRIAAVARIDEADVLRALAIDTSQKEVGLAAVDKIDDVERLENVAQKAKTKAVRQRARKIVGEIEEAERAKKPQVPDEVKRRRAEKAQLLREVDAVADSFDFAKASEIVTAAEAAWSKLAADDGDDRFGKTVERFWKRKELHEQQARSTDELRAIEREAAAERERAAQEKAQRAPAPVDAEPELAADDPKRIAREAEAAARREERERQRAEEDARRAAQAAERAAKQKEDAERGAAIAASLTALCADMEGLAAQDARDTRAIDRLLSQATKAFEQIGKVPAAERDTLADRYRVARGKLVTKAGELREAEDWARWANVPKAEALIQTAKQMLEAPATPDLGNRLRQLQALWKEVGPMPQRRSKELWEQFKASCDQVYDKVKGQRAVENEKFGEVAKVKEALIAEAEAIADSTEWGSTAEKLKALQQQWKQSGYLPRKQGDELWKRFRAACDRFFERRKPELDARRAEETQNLAAKHALIARAQAVAAAAPAEGGWGKSIAEIKELQRQWKEIGFVPRRDADAVYKAFRAACDALFVKRDAARDSEANAHRAEIEALAGEIAAVRAGTGDDLAARAIAARSKAVELGALAPEVSDMVRYLIEQHADAIRGTELDPAQLRGKRDKLIARAEELLPKQAAAPAEGVDLAAQLKNAMRQNAFGDLRFSGRDPVEVIDELRAAWADVGPILDEADRAQQQRFDDTAQRVLDAAGVKARARDERPTRDDRDDDARGGRRRRRDRRSAEHPIADSVHSPVEVVPDAAANAVAVIAAPDEVTAQASIPVATYDAVTQPATLPPEPAIPEPEPAMRVASGSEPPVRTKPITMVPPVEALDTGWDLGDEDPTASPEPADAADAAADAAADPAGTSTPSSSEMAGDGAVEGDGLDTGWD